MTDQEQLNLSETESAEPTQASSIYTISERALAKQIGVTREMIIDLRLKNLKRGEFWEKVGVHVYYTPEGAKQILGIFVPNNVKVTLEEPNEYEVEITRIWPNRRLMEAKRTGLAAQASTNFNVRVSRNDNFVPGMLARAKHFVGDSMPTIVSRLPRRRGKY